MAVDDVIAALSPLFFAKLDEGSGTTVGDSGSGGNDGTLTGGTWGSFPDFPGLPALLLDGVDDQIEVPGSDFNFKNDDAFAAVVLFQLVGDPNDLFAYTALMDKTGVSSGNGQWAIEVENEGGNNRILKALTARGANGHWESHSAVDNFLVTGGLVAITRGTGSGGNGGEKHIYIVSLGESDTVQEVDSYPSDDDGVDMNDNGLPLFIGRRSGSWGGGGFINGYFAKPAVFDYELSIQDVQDIHDALFAEPSSAPVLRTASGGYLRTASGILRPA